MSWDFVTCTQAFPCLALSSVTTVPLNTLCALTWPSEAGPLPTHPRDHEPGQLPGTHGHFLVTPVQVCCTAWSSNPTRQSTERTYFLSDTPMWLVSSLGIGIHLGHGAASWRMRTWTLLFTQPRFQSRLQLTYWTS